MGQVINFREEVLKRRAKDYWQLKMRLLFGDKIQLQPWQEKVLGKLELLK